MTNGDPIELNEYGMAVWRHRANRNLFVERSYNWCDCVTVIDETDGRRVVTTTEHSTFDFADWIPVTKEEFKKVHWYFKEIYNNFRQIDDPSWRPSQEQP